MLSTSQFSPQEFGEFQANVANASLVISKIVSIHSLVESCRAGAVLGEGIMSVVTSCAADMQKIPVSSAVGHCNKWQGKPWLGFG